MLRAVTENVLLEIQKTFDFFKATASSDQMDRIMLSGGASRVDGFREMLQDRFNAPVEDFDPFRSGDVGREETAGRSGGHGRHGRRRRRPGAQKGERPVIRINLLGVERQKARKAIVFDVGQRLTLACSLIVVAAALLIGWWYWSLNQESTRVDAEIVAAQQEAARLQSLLAEVTAVRGAPRTASAARRAHRAAAQRAERSSAAPRPREPEPARHAVADGDGRRTATRSRSQGGARRSSRSRISSATSDARHCS